MLQNIYSVLELKMGLPWQLSAGKDSAYNAGDPGSIPGSGRSPGEGSGNPVLLPGKSHGQRSLVGYSPWGHKELDMSEQLHFNHMEKWKQYPISRRHVYSLSNEV